MEIKTTYDNCKMLIAAGRFTSADMGILSLFLMVGAISNDQYVELTGMIVSARTKPVAATDVSNSASAPVAPAVGDTSTIPTK